MFTLQQALLAVIPHAATTRASGSYSPILSAVHFRPADGTVEATDRYTMGIANYELSDPPTVPEGEFTLSLADAKTLSKVKVPCLHFVVTSGHAYEGDTVRFEFGSQTLQFRTVEGDYPNLGRLVGRGGDGVLAHGASINPSHLARFTSASERGIPITLTYAKATQDGAAEVAGLIRVTSGDSFIGAMAPVRLPDAIESVCVPQSARAEALRASAHRLVQEAAEAVRSAS
jgi:hypothetical protein